MRFLLLLLISTGLYANSIHDLSFDGKKGKKINLADYKGSPILIVNIATKCGYTPQLEGLQKVYSEYKDKGLKVIGVPSNEFGGQSPENDEGIEKFCSLNYGVKFPLTKKAIVKGDKKNPVYKYLIENTNKNEIRWNFEKFLISKDGKTIKRYNSGVSPDNKEFISDIKKAL